MVNEQTHLNEVDSDETSVDDLTDTPNGGAPGGASDESGAKTGAGERLRSAREARRMELEQVAAETRIPIRHLESIEASAFDALPSRTYAIGFARSYARVVGLDEKSIADAVREELAESGEHRRPVPGGMEPGDAAKLPSRGLAWFGAIAALLLIAGVLAFASRYFGAGVELPSLMADGDDAAETVPEQMADAAGENSSADAATTATAASAEGQVVFTATGEGAWVRFYEEGGERLYEGVMEDGDTYEVPLDAQDPRINTGRPNLFNITIGGVAVPPLATEMVPVSDAPVSAAALLARGNGEEGEGGSP
ncbi:DUF4115 domain-containing protein [Erythrobacter sp. SCSIO 43205]|uniref:helix-turn-helix domain-containing protein n=1 Tax=Erythrobacter sp. SCSIO 43205 TaxID=2779361 RepID=UPI001CA7BBFB|nr:helix-turn-helix domain-containing protein [Erythrobacter sp. SCSIO 43205]UAB77943.1 DUF4115 domain-containing protein [Erythrobacter sp. SCSIO 43205]